MDPSRGRATEARRRAVKKAQTEPFDLVVVGGGIVGAGCARDAAMRGLKVALFERGDFAVGTSSRSSKMVHGGLRYLEQRAFGLVSEACAERRALQRMAPHVVRPRSFVIPAYRGHKPGRWEVEAGMWLYDAVALFRNTRLHRPLGRRALERMEPGLLSQGLAGGGLFFDCVTDDARLTILNVLDAASKGAVCLNYAPVTAVLVEGGRAAGVEVHDLLADGVVQVKARSVVNAAGPWSDEVSRLADGSVQRRIRVTKGVHVVVPRDRLDHVRALVLRSPDDRRVFFVVPWGSLSLVGTTDTDYDGPLEQARAEPTDVRYLLRAIAHYFPKSTLNKSDIVSAYAGLRPLMRQEGVSPSAVTREHALFVGPVGFVTVVGGKLTTYRRMAAQIVEEAARSAGLPIKAANTKRRALPGGDAVPAQPSKAAAAIARKWGVPIDEADTLYWTHGSSVAQVLQDSTPALRGRVHPSLPYLHASVAWAFSSEVAQTLEDALVRRVPLALRLPDGGASVAEEVARVVSPVAGWDRHQVAQHVEDFVKSREVADAWRRAM